jgi:hypothetical protein
MRAHIPRVHHILYQSLQYGGVTVMLMMMMMMMMMTIADPNDTEEILHPEVVRY